LDDLLKPFINFAKEPLLRQLVQAVEVLLVAYLLYRVLALVRGTRAWRIVLGLLVFFVVLTLSTVFHLDTLNYLLDKATLLMPVALAILFLPELRQAIEGVGKLGFWTQKLVSNEVNVEARTIEEVVAAAAEMSGSRMGALIVIEKGPPLSEIVSNGVQLDAKVSDGFLGAMFYLGNPLHDGAVIIRGSVIIAAACRLPLSEDPRIDSSFHMRHRAAMGIAEQQDCVVVVISEERGSISVASDGKLRRLGSPSELRDVLNQELRQGSLVKPNGSRRKPFARTKQLK